jgi:hypothetical protein
MLLPVRSVFSASLTYMSCVEDRVASFFSRCPYSNNLLPAAKISEIDSMNYRVREEKGSLAAKNGGLFDG